MMFFRNMVLMLLFLAGTVPSFSQSYIDATKSLIWDLGPDDPRIKVQLGTKGINIGGYEDVAPVITNNFSNELLVKVEFSLTDYCGETKVYTMVAETLSAHERYAPSPFFAGFSFGTGCKKFAEYGPEKDKEKTRIHRISHRILILRDLTQEKKAAEEEKARKERELALKRQQEEEAKRKAEEARKAEQGRLAEERKKEEDARKAEAEHRGQDERHQANARPEAEQTGAGSGTSSGGSGTSAASHQEDVLAQQREAEQIAEEKRAQEQAAQVEAEKEHARISYEKQLADIKRREEERLAEERRQQELLQKRMQNARDAQAVREANEDVQELQQLNARHSNIEQMEQEYAEKLRQLNTAMKNLEQAKQQEWTSRVQSTDWSGQYGQEVGELVQTTGAFVNSLGEEKRKREAKERLERQRQEFLARVEKEKAQMRFDLRTQMLKNFNAWKLPAAPAHEPARIYGFYVLYNYNGLAAERCNLIVSNIAEIGTYSDGTWPSLLYFQTLEKEQRTQFQYSYFHSNHYNSYAQAEQAKKALTQLFSKDGTVSQTHIECSINTANQRMDFWESGIVPQK